MALFLPENQYRGINAHLHSYLIRHGEWRGFHTMHLTDLTRAIQHQLTPETGYYVTVEKSLQISWYEQSDIQGKRPRKSSVPDVGIYRDTQYIATGMSQAAVANPPALILPVSYVFREPDDVNAIAIWKVQPDSENRELITRIELLSPANKPPGSHAEEYLYKRSETLQAGIKLVELDYLHEQRSPVPDIPDYTQGEYLSFPYLIIISDSKHTEVHGAYVNEALPLIRIPLDDDKAFMLNLNTVYQTSFNGNINYAARIVDYEKLPQGIEKYTENDQQHILAVMQRAKTTASQE